MKRAVLPLLALGLLLAAAPSVASAEVMHYEVVVEGLACPFCAFGLERKLRELPGVDTVEVELSSGTARFDVAEGRVVLPAAIRSAVAEAGFTIGSIEVRASGQVTIDGSDVWLVLGPNQRLLLRGDRVGSLRAHPGAATLTGTITRTGDREVMTVEHVRAA